MAYSKKFISWLKSIDQRHTGLSKFRQNGSYKKKPKKDNDWREFKQFKRDKSKYNCYNTGKPGRWFKNLDHRLRRNYERYMLQTEQYDELAGNEHSCQHLDPWSWD